jgi:hypothetical protein
MNPISMHRPLRNAASGLALMAAAVAAQAGALPLGWDESINGDLSNDGLAPTFVSMLPGSNIIAGTTGRSVAGGPVDRDYFRIQVPSGYVLSSLTVLAGTAVLGDGSFIGLMAGPTFSVPPTTSDATGLLGWTLFSANDIGEDLLPAMSTPFFGSSGFSTPLPAGNYSFWVQETSVGTSVYRLDLHITAVPEPATALSLLAGLGLLAVARRRRQA